MTDRDSFLDFLREHPDDVVARMAFADWLSDRGEGINAQAVLAEVGRKVEKVADLLGLLLVRVENRANEEIVFTTAGGRQYRLYHNQDCCEYVLVHDINGDLNDLVGSPITLAEESENSDEPAPEGEGDKSHTWTFYRFATARGYVDIRWLGTSNGYYSESVDFGVAK